VDNEIKKRGAEAPLSFYDLFLAAEDVIGEGAQGLASRILGQQFEIAAGVNAVTRGYMITFLND
jgi:hypothetical protein